MFLTLHENRLNNLESLKQSRLEITEAIKGWSNDVKELTGKLEAATLEKLEETYKQNAVIISDQIEECKSAIAAIETVSQQVLKYLKKYDTVDDECKDYTLEFPRDENFESVVKTLSSLGQVLSKASKIPGLFPDIAYQRAMVLSPRAQKNSMQTWKAKLEDDVASCEIYSGIFLNDDRIVLCDNGNKKLKLFDQLYHCVSCLKMTEEPRFMCSVDTETLAVTTGGLRIEIVSVASTLTRLRSISVDGECYGLAFYHTNIIVDIYDGEKDEFLIYNKSNKVIKRIPIPDHVSLPLDALCMSPDVKSIYYTVENRLVTLDMDGEELSTFESDDLAGACGITVDRNGILYCCGEKSQTVILVTHAGRQLDVLLSRDDGLKNPIGICLNKKNNVILVTERHSNKVKMFKLI
ncbi:hypothetical protein CHS0354_009533 [Potamilus streckersoni]|uniref:Uncharacterized protein n=1 Tax=Potamilus streckersoni TaxID=2493646 RepID=A0AAE0W039_9BIVA|nr:hypothetical protein CHS0354_009533 [Potamilus streckersoni]